MSKKKRKVVVEDDWMDQLDTMASNSKKRGGNDHLFRLSSFPEELLRDGYSIKWRPFSFKIDELGSTKSRSMSILEYGVEDARPVDVRLGTQPMALLDTHDLSDVVLHCDGYSVSDLQGRPQLFIWKMETAEMIEEAMSERRRRDRQLRLPVLKLKRKKKKRS